MTGSFFCLQVWANPTVSSFGTSSFDNIFSAIIFLLEVASADDWETATHEMADAPSKAGNSAYRDDGWHSFYALFCVIFAFVTQLCLMKLLVSVVIDAFYLTEGSGLLTKDQTTVKDMHQYCKQLAPTPKAAVPEERWRACCYYLFTDIRPLPIEEIEFTKEMKSVPKNTSVASLKSDRRDFTMTKEMIARQSNPMTKARMEITASRFERDLKEKNHELRVLRSCSRDKLRNEELPESGTEFSRWIHVCGAKFESVMTVLVVTNVIIMCTVHYEQPKVWDDFIFWQNVGFNAIFTIEMALKIIGLGCKAYWTSPFDAFDGFTVLATWAFVSIDGEIGGIIRVGRVFRLVKRAPRLQNLLSTLMYTLPSIANVAMVLLLLFFIFAVIGVELFGQVRYGYTYNIVSNMSTWPAAMHMLWRASTDNYRGSMYDLMVIVIKKALVYKVIWLCRWKLLIVQWTRTPLKEMHTTIVVTLDLQLPFSLFSRWALAL